MKSRFLFRESGQALIVIALGAVVLFGFMALAIDGSAKFSDRRHAQNAADTAALAASLARVNAIVAGQPNTPANCPPSSGSPSAVCSALLTAGKNRASDNGYDNNLTTNTVEVYSPPISGYYAGRTNYVQVIITSHVKTYFMRILGIDESVNIAQAVSLSSSSGSLFNGATVVSLDPSPTCGNGSVKVSGSGTVTLTGGGLFVNSSAGCGFVEPNCTNFVINGGGVSSAGSPISMPNPSKCTNPSANTTAQQFYVPDDIYMPDIPSACTTKTPGVHSVTKKGNTATAGPGYYTSFPPDTGNNLDITLSSGTYCIDGDIKWTSGSFHTLTGSGVTFYITSGHSFDMSGGTLNLSAQTTGTYANYLIILNGSQSSIQSCTINGGGGGTITGTVFAPYCNITVNGNSGTDSLSSQIIGYDVTLNGNNMLNFTYNPGQNAKNPRRVGLLK